VNPARRPPSAPPAKPPLDLRLGVFFLWLLLLVPPFLWAPVAKESFRQPKLLASEWLALASLAALAWGLRRVREVSLAEVWRLPAVRMAVPCLLVATVGLAATRHPIHVREALIDLWIGAAALVGWSAALPAFRLERLLRGLLWPATALALVGIAQYLGLFQPLQFAELTPGSRLAITSLAGNPADLAAYLVLPCLVAQTDLRRLLRAGGGWGSPGTLSLAAALAVSTSAILLTQTLSAVAALFAGSAILWGARVPRRRAAAILLGGALAVALLAVAVPPLRQRVMKKVQAAAAGNWDEVLTGRMDGWRAAAWMVREHPLTGVGHGAYAAEFAPARLALMERGVPFYLYVGFDNPHDEILDVAAEWGLPGLLALGWALWALLEALRRRGGKLPDGDRALAWAGLAAFAVLSLVDFPFRVALVAFPALLFLSWILRALRPVPASEGS
jgi:O-antigen ligase